MFLFFLVFCFCLFVCLFVCFFPRESKYCKLTVLGCSVIATSKRQIFVSGLRKSSLNSELMQHEFWNDEVQPEEPSYCFKQKEG